MPTRSTTDKQRKVHESTQNRMGESTQAADRLSSREGISSSSEPSSSSTRDKTNEASPPNATSGYTNVKTNKKADQAESSNRATSSSNPVAKADDNPQRRKKSSSLVGFLTLKEPSAKALEEFAQAEKERTEQKGVKSTVSSQKLPDHVPKVNSKWDGLPESATRRDSSSRAGERSIKSPVSATYPKHLRWDSSSSTQQGTALDKQQSSSSIDASSAYTGSSSSAAEQLSPRPGSNMASIAAEASSDGQRQPSPVAAGARPVETIATERVDSRAESARSQSLLEETKEGKQPSSKSTQRSNPVNFSRPLRRPT